MSEQPQGFYCHDAILGEYRCCHCGFHAFSKKKAAEHVDTKHLTREPEMQAREYESPEKLSKSGLSSESVKRPADALAKRSSLSPIKFASPLTRGSDSSTIEELRSVKKPKLEMSSSPKTNKLEATSSPKSNKLEATSSPKPNKTSFTKIRESACPTERPNFPIFSGNFLMESFDDNGLVTPSGMLMMPTTSKFTQTIHASELLVQDMSSISLANSERSKSVAVQHECFTSALVFTCGKCPFNTTMKVEMEAHCRMKHSENQCSYIL